MKGMYGVYCKYVYGIYMGMVIFDECVLFVLRVFMSGGGNGVCEWCVYGW